jgi:hypothetical protein
MFHHHPVCMFVYEHDAANDRNSFHNDLRHNICNKSYLRSLRKPALVIADV